MPDLREKRVELILQQLEHLPTLPTVAIRVLEATSSDDSSARQVVQLIEADPALTTRILQLVHRADQGVRGEINSVERAVVLLGFEAVRCAVLAVSVFAVFQGSPRAGSPQPRFNHEEFWRHSLAVACCAELLAESATSTQQGAALELAASEAFLCGLLHDLGKIALARILPKSFDRVVEAVDLLRGNIADVERTVIGLDHMVVGKRLAERWGLPAGVRDCIWLHGQSPQGLPATVRNAAMVNLVTLADVLARQHHLGYSGNYTFPIAPETIQSDLGLTQRGLQTAQTNLMQRIEQRAELLGIGRSAAGELYLSALTRANQELGKVAEQLAARNRRLASRAAFFDALARFQDDLRPDAPAALVMQAIGHTATGTLGCSPAVVFSMPPGQPFADVAVVDKDGQVIGSSVLECAVRPARPPGGVGPVLCAGGELEWLVATVSPRLSGEQRFWICLEAEGACIGGVLWGAAAGESQRLGTQAQELTALAGGWSLALRTAQIREESRSLAEQLAEANRRLQSAHDELLRSRTLVSVGEMAAGAAHEMNNPLAVISGRSQLLASELSDPRLKHAAVTIVEQSHRLSQIITDLMEFAKPVPARPRDCDLAELLDRALYEAKCLSDPGQRRFEVTVGQVPPVRVDASQVQEAFTQILHNAIQATDERNGQIEVHAAYDAFSSRVAVTVSDNGRGMDQATVKRAFDPFFSAQPAGRRRGMGLAKALRWIESSGGSIRLESHLNQGTRVMVLLPAARGPEAPGQDARSAAEE